MILRVHSDFLKLSFFAGGGDCFVPPLWKALFVFDSFKSQNNPFMFDIIVTISQIRSGSFIALIRIVTICEVIF